MRGSLNTRQVRQTNEQGSHFRVEMVSVRYLPCDEYRYTPVVSKKQGSAVQRNRVKRVIRSIMSSQRERFPKGYYLIYFRGSCDNLKRELMEKNLGAIATQAPVVEKTKENLPQRHKDTKK